MHPIQEKLLELSSRHDLKQLGLRKIGRMIGEEHPQKIKYHLSKLGLLEGKKKPGDRLAPPKGKQLHGVNFYSIPLYGAANCGEATLVADSRIEGHLSVSHKMLSKKPNDNYFAVKAFGASMNKASVEGKNIEDGDYVIVDGQDRYPKDGDYVLSITNGMANIKKFVKDEKNNMVVLLSESRQYFPPIYIHEDDLNDYVINGKVVQVIEGPRSDDVYLDPIS